MLVIKRWEMERLSRGGWLLVYGRRKVGKTFMLRRMDHDLYITVTRSGDALLDEEIVDLSEAMRLAVRTLRQGGTVVVDEFQRMDLWELLASPHPEGRLILSGSSFGIISKVFDPRSPLLGLLEPFRVGIISFWDSLISLNPRGRDELLWSVLVRDPWIIPMADLNERPESFIRRKAEGLYMAARGLVGEVFSEEERELTRLYELVLLLLGEGVWNLRDMANVLSSRGVIQGVQSLTGILDRLVKMGLVTKVKAWRSRSRYFYRHSSPLLSTIFYLEAKYGISEGYRPPEGAISSVLGRELEFSVGELLAEWHEGSLAYHRDPEGDVDVLILKGGRALVGYEVKAGEITRGEVRKKREYMSRLGIEAKFVASEGPADMGVEDLKRIAKDLSSRYRKA